MISICFYLQNVIRLKKKEILFFFIVFVFDFQNFYFYFDYDQFFMGEIDKKKRDDIYCIFKKVNCLVGVFLYALDYSNIMMGKGVIVWCSNDYFGMSRYLEVLKIVM